MANRGEDIRTAFAHHKAGRLAEAAELYQAILRENPMEADALHLLGVLTHQRGDAAAAESLIRRALAINPNAPLFHNNLGKAVEDLGDRAGAITSYRRALSLAPDYGEAHYNLGVALQADGDYAAAEAAYRRAWALDAGHFKAAINLGAVLLAQGRPHEALETLRQAFALKPDDEKAHRALRVAVLYDPAMDEETRFTEQERLQAQFVHPGTEPASHPNPRDPERRLRIGWVSSDFHDHPVARNLEPIFMHRDRQRFETFCYADVPKPDAVTAQYQSQSDVWRPIAGRTDKEVAELIRSDGIDILVVLAGRFDHNRPLVAAYRPAPLQVSFHDPATSGLKAMDYLLADPVLVPRRAQEKFTERVLRLPSFYIHPPLMDAPPVGPLPATAAGHVTFGSFNSPLKVNERVMALWGAVMGQVPGSRLRLRYRNRFQPLRARLGEILATAGVSEDRLEVGDGLLDHANHLALYNRVDIALDPFPFTGSTTTFEALWMGVPVVTLLGTNMAGRWSASMLHALKLEALIARTPEEYVAKVAALANDLPRLAALRATLRERLARSPLCDGSRRTRQIERLFRAMWRRWCREPAA